MDDANNYCSCDETNLKLLLRAPRGPLDVEAAVVVVLKEDGASSLVVKLLKFLWLVLEVTELSKRVLDPTTLLSPPLILP